MGKTGIIIVNTGSPAAPTSEAVAEYLRAFLSDPRICPMNPRLWRLILNRFIIPKRARSRLPSTQRYGPTRAHRWMRE